MVEMKDVCLNIGGKQLFNSLSFIAKEGDIFCISGAEGCGKSSLLRTFIGLQQPTSGFVSIDGELITPLSAPYFRKQIAYLPQDLNLQATTVADLFNTLATLRTNTARQLSRNKLLTDWQQLDVAGNMWNQPLQNINRSTLQRILLSITVAPIKSILLLDEPASEQDDKGAKLVKNYISRLRNEQSIIIIATNDSQITSICNKHIVLENQS